MRPLNRPRTEIQSTGGQYLENLRRTARDAESLEQLRELLPADLSWGKFYQTAHSNQVEMAWQQTRSMAEKWAED